MTFLEFWEAISWPTKYEPTDLMGNPRHRTISGRDVMDLQPRIGALRAYMEKLPLEKGFMEELDRALNGAEHSEHPMVVVRYIERALEKKLGVAMRWSMEQEKYEL